MEDLMNEMETTMDEIQYIVVKLGNEKYGIDISCVDNIVRMQHMTRVPKSQSYYVGVINLRGEVVPIMSLRRRFGLEDDVCQSATRIIIIRMQDQSLIGVIVDDSILIINILTCIKSDGRIKRQKTAAANAVFRQIMFGTLLPFSKKSYLCSGLQCRPFRLIFI